MNKLSKVTAVALLSAVTLSASGWRIPEQSLNSVALSAAYVANANGADASYSNPANMVFMPDGSSFEQSITFINLEKIEYTDARSAAYNTDSKVENFIMPTFHYVSPFVNDFRFGLSVVAPGGLSKRWDEAYGKATAEEFSLTVIEINPTVSYKVNDKFAIGFGLRGVYSEGVVKSDATGLGSPATRDMTGDSIDFGYNLALSYKATDNLTLASTYRSNVDLNEDGKATLVGGLYKGGAEVSVPLPASLTLAAAYSFDKTTVEFVYERTYWSEYKELDFGYDVDLTATPMAPFDLPVAKNWDDVNAYRIGITHQYNDKLTLMAGYAYDEAGAKKETLGFELPDSDAQLFSFGFDYKLNEKMNVGLAYLYDKKDELSVNHTATDPAGIYGEFKNASAHLLTLSLKYKF